MHISYELTGYRVRKKILLRSSLLWGRTEDERRWQDREEWEDERPEGKVMYKFQETLPHKNSDRLKKHQFFLHKFSDRLEDSLYFYSVLYPLPSPSCIYSTQFASIKYRPKFIKNSCNLKKVDCIGSQATHINR